MGISWIKTFFLSFSLFKIHVGSQIKEKKFSVIDTYKLNASVGVLNFYQNTTVMNCADHCIADKDCVSVSYNQVLRICLEHTLDPSRSLYELQREKEWKILYPSGMHAVVRQISFSFRG